MHNKARSILETALGSPYSLGIHESMHEMFKKLDPVNNSFPYFNTFRDGNNYQVDLAVPGYPRSSLKIEFCDDILTITGTATPNTVDVDWISRNIANRDFKRTFAVSKDCIIKSAKLDNGILSIILEKQIPEENVIKTINID